jgi:hypothetical protein
MPKIVPKTRILDSRAFPAEAPVEEGWARLRKCN